MVKEHPLHITWKDIFHGKAQARNALLSCHLSMGYWQECSMVFKLFFPNIYFNIFTSNVLLVIAFTSHRSEPMLTSVLTCVIGCIKVIC